MRLNYIFFILVLFSSCKSDKEIEVVTVEPEKPIEKIEIAEPEVKLDTAFKIKEPLETENKAVHQKAKEVASVVPKNKVVRKRKVKRTPKSKDALKKKKPYATFAWQSKEFNFGEITEGDIIEHSFKFMNNSKTPLEIASVTPSCGCTLPSYPFLAIDPGSSNEIGVTYNSVNKDGDQAATITIVANTNPATTVLYLKGRVKPKEKEVEATESTDTTEPTNTTESTNTKETKATSIKDAKESKTKGKRIKKDAKTKIGVNIDNNK